MELEPSDTHFRDAVVEEMRQITRRPAVAWMGFTNLIWATVQCELFDEEARVIERGLKYFICLKAILWLKRYEGGKVRGNIVVMGSREVFSVTLYDRTGEAVWEPPDRFDQIVISEFAGWEG